MRTTPVDRDEFDRLSRRIDELEQKIIQIRNNTTPTVPVYDSTNFPQDAVEGQVAIADA